MLPKPILYFLAGFILILVGSIIGTVISLGIIWLIEHVSDTIGAIIFFLLVAIGSLAVGYNIVESENNSE